MGVEFLVGSCSILRGSATLTIVLLSIADAIEVKRRKLSSDLTKDMKSVKRSIQSILSLTKDSKIPLGLKKVLKDAFKCVICMGVVKPPVITGRCCQRILGCESCVNKWFSGPDALQKACPHCSSPRGYSETIMLKGIDDFLTTIGNVFSGTEEES